MVGANDLLKGMRLFSAAKDYHDGNINPQVNPETNVNPGIGNHPSHLGDLPNLVVDENRKGTLWHHEPGHFSFRIDDPFRYCWECIYYLWTRRQIPS